MGDSVHENENYDDEYEDDENNISDDDDASDNSYNNEEYYSDEYDDVDDFNEPYPANDAHELIKNTATGMLLGLLAGLLSISLKGKTSTSNTYFWKLKTQWEGLEGEIDLCLWYLSIERKFRHFNPEVYDEAIEKTSDLGFLLTRIENGVLKKYVEQVRQGKLDPTYDIDYDQVALTLWYDIHYTLKELVLSVRRSEQEEFDKLKELDTNYTLALKAWEIDTQKWTLEKLAFQSSNKKSFFSTNKPDASTSSTNNKELRPAPIQPTRPTELNVQLKSDICEQYTTLIDERTMTIVKYIQKSVAQFRKENPSQILIE